MEGGWTPTSHLPPSSLLPSHSIDGTVTKERDDLGTSVVNQMGGGDSNTKLTSNGLVKIE